MPLFRVFPVFVGVAVIIAVLVVAVPGCNRTPPAPPPMTPETQAAIQAEDREVFEAERAQR